MNLSSALLWGLVATLVFTTMMSASQALGVSRIGIPSMLGTMFTADRDRAPIVGFGAHSVLGLAFALLYAAIFDSVGRAGWALGALLGLGHGFVMLIVFIPMLPGIHPRMASERDGPDPTRALEPPGFLALNYGRRTPLIVLLSHVVYGIILGAFYHVSAGR